MLDIDDSDEDKPLVKLAQKKKAIEKAAAQDARPKKPVATKAAKDESDSDDAPLAKIKKRPVNGTAKTNGVKKEESDSDAPIRKKAKPAPAKPAPAAKGKANGKISEDARWDQLHRFSFRPSTPGRHRVGSLEPAETCLARPYRALERRRPGHLGDNGGNRQVEDLRVALAGALLV